MICMDTDNYVNVLSTIKKKRQKKVNFYSCARKLKKIYCKTFHRKICFN